MMTGNNGQLWFAVIKWILGLLVAGVLGLSAFFSSWQFRQDDAIAKSMGPEDRASVQQQLGEIKQGINRMDDRLLRYIDRCNDGK